MDQIPAAMDRHLDVIQCHTGLSKMLFKLSHNDTTDTNKTRHLPVLSFFINFWFSTNKESFKCQFISLSCTIQLLCRYLVHTWLLLINEISKQQEQRRQSQSVDGVIIVSEVKYRQ